MSTSLRSFNTFGIQANALRIVIAQTVEQLTQAWSKTVADDRPVLILGEGSNVLFLSDFAGTVIINRITGIEITQKEDAWHLHIGAGENWHNLVKYTLQHKMPGLENLALIPGCVGSSPIQNIGAYGVELKQVCDYVDCVDLRSGEQHRLSNAQCEFGYRDSIFKHAYQKNFAITAVGLRLPKLWQPVLTYGDLTRLDRATVSPDEVFDSVCHMRTTKLPDPRVNGNAGSFFKNPVITGDAAAEILSAFPTAPHYPQPDGSVKFAAGWLIDQCELKGYTIGGAAVHKQQALVLINQENATSLDVVHLAHHIRQSVGEKFNVWLEPEVRFIGQNGEVSAVETIT